MGAEQPRPLPENISPQVQNAEQMGMVRFHGGTVTVWQNETGVLVQVERGNEVLPAFMVPRTVFDASFHAVGTQQEAVVFAHINGDPLCA